MRLLLTALIATFAIAVTASVFAIWPVVADAPWEDSTEPVIEDRTDKIRCQGAYEVLQSAIEALGQLGSLLPQRTYEIITQQLDIAEREISRYC